MSVTLSPEGQRGHIGIGTTLEYTVNSGQSYTLVARLTEIGEINLTGTANEVDVTGYDTEGFVREKIRGLGDSGSISITGVWIAHASQEALANDSDLNDVVGWRATLPYSLGVITFDAYIHDVMLNPQLDDRIEFSGELVISGKPTLTIPGGDGDGDGDGA